MRGIKNTGDIIVTKTRTCSFSDSSKGDCFYISTSTEQQEDLKGDCFKSSAFDRPCFYVKCEEEYDIVETAEDIDMATLGFIEIKCVTSHGLNEIVVVGKHRETPTSDIEDVVAKVLHYPSSQGGIGAVGALYYKQTLEEMSILLSPGDEILYDDIAYIDCYDTTRSTSDLAIVTDSHAYWINSVVLTISNTSIGHANEAEALKHPFYLEDTYGVGEWSLASTASCSAVVPHYIAEDCTTGLPSEGWTWDVCASGCEHTVSTSNPPVYDTGSLGERMLSYNISNGADNKTNIAKDLLTTSAGVNGGVNVPGGYDSSGITGLRGNVAIIGDRLYGKNLAEDEFQYTEGCHSEEALWAEGLASSCFSYGGTGDVWRKVRYLYCGAFFDKTIYDSLAVLSFTLTETKKLQSDNIYTAVAGGAEGMEYSKIDGTKTGTYAATNFTLVKGVLLIADGTSILSQVVLDDEV